MLKENTQAPDFTLTDQDGKEHTLSDYRGRWILVYFYPKDNTPGCTKEACALRDVFPRFEGLQAQVFGISADSVEKHMRFAEQYNLPFPILADTEKTTIKAYGAFGTKKFMGREYEGIMRMSFLIDPEGMIQKIYEKVKPETHAEEVLKDLETLMS